jgi:hypothetical protein
MMRIVDRNALTDLDYFWMNLGVLQGKAWMADRHEDIEIVAGANVVEALQKQGSVEAGKGAYYYGIKLVMDDALNATGQQLDDALQFALMMKIGEVSLVKVNVSQEKRKVTKKAVTEHDSAGRILSWIEEEVEI